MFIKKMNKAVILLALLSISAFAQGTFTDSRDGKKYKSVKIGEQTWMAQNLDYKGKDGKLGVCYGKKPANCTKYGRLYDWAAAMDIDAKFNNEKWGGSDEKHQGICPEGWHLPSKNEFKTLVDFVAATAAAAAGFNIIEAQATVDEIEANKNKNLNNSEVYHKLANEREEISKKINEAKWIVGIKLNAKSGWDKCKGERQYNRYSPKVKYDFCGTDDYGFSFLPGGHSSSDGNFHNVGIIGNLWGASESGEKGEWLFSWSIREGLLGSGGDIKSNGNSYSVRCLQD